jgi:L-serine deaminase
MKGEKLQMAAKLMSTFAAGLIVAASVCGAVYLLDPSEVTSTQTVEKPSEKEMKNVLTSAGYIIHTEEEWKEKLAAIEVTETKKGPVDEVKETIVYRAILNVSPGMTSIDVGKVLVQANITDNAMTFFNEVEKRGLSNDLRPGTYEIDSEMTIDEVISTIFK